ncbi:MAG: hypothetical protein RL328_1850 [Acidobacteriota bacterium]
MKTLTRLTRRTWLALLSAPALPIWAATGRCDRTAHQDFILGTSLDLTVAGSTASEAEAAEAAALAEIGRLSAILNRRDPHSELNRWANGIARPGVDLQRVLAAYVDWEQRTGGVIAARRDGTMNLDALGKAYIVDRAAEAAHAAAPHAAGILLDIGGDVRAIGSAWNIGIADPAQPFENAAPLTEVRVAAAMATSGTYARGSHIEDARTGLAGPGSAASVLAADCLTANALALAACAMPVEYALQLIEQTPQAEGLLIARSGALSRSSGFARYETGRLRRVAFAGWTNGYQVTVHFSLVDPAGGGDQGGGGFGGRRGGFGGKGGFGRPRRPYIVIWAEDASGKVVRTISLWASKPRWIADLHTWWSKAPNTRQASQMARATRGAGEYSVVWNGMNDAGEPVAPGTYKIFIETNREHGNHYQESVTIDCGAKPSSAAMKPTAEFQNVKVDFGPVTGTV